MHAFKSFAVPKTNDSRNDANRRTATDTIWHSSNMQQRPAQFTRVPSHASFNHVGPVAATENPPQPFDKQEKIGTIGVECVRGCGITTGRTAIFPGMPGKDGAMLNTNHRHAKEEGGWAFDTTRGNKIRFTVQHNDGYYKLSKQPRRLQRKIQRHTLAMLC